MVKRLQRLIETKLFKYCISNRIFNGNNTAEDKTNKSQEIYILPEKRSK